MAAPPEIKNLVERPAEQHRRNIWVAPLRAAELVAGNGIPLVDFLRDARHVPGGGLVQDQPSVTGDQPNRQRRVLSAPVGYVGYSAT